MFHKQAWNSCGFARTVVVEHVVDSCSVVIESEGIESNCSVVDRPGDSVMSCKLLCPS